MLFTAGDKDGSIDGQPMNGVPFRYHSFSEDGYRTVLARNGFALEDVHSDPGQNIYYLARRWQGEALYRSDHEARAPRHRTNWRG